MTTDRAATPKTIDYKGRKMPKSWFEALFPLHALLVDHGYSRSAEVGLPVDAAGDPIPLYTYPAIEYLDQLDFADAHVFEFGSGHSTLFWSARTASVTAVEHDFAWADRMKTAGRDNVTIVLPSRTEVAEGEHYGAILTRQGRSFDVIAIDALHQYECALAAPAALAPGGVVILDNSDWNYESARVLREAGLLQIDLAGFKPCHVDAQVTSLFLKRDFDRAALAGRRPRTPPGGVARQAPFDRPKSRIALK